MSYDNRYIGPIHIYIIDVGVSFTGNISGNFFPVLQEGYHQSITTAADLIDPETVSLLQGERITDMQGVFFILVDKYLGKLTFLDEAPGAWNKWIGLVACKICIPHEPNGLECIPSVATVLEVLWDGACRVW